MHHVHMRWMCGTSWLVWNLLAGTRHNTRAPQARVAGVPPARARGEAHGAHTRLGFLEREAVAELRRVRDAVRVRERVRDAVRVRERVRDEVPERERCRDGVTADDAVLVALRLRAGVAEALPMPVDVPAAAVLDSGAAVELTLTAPVALLVPVAVAADDDVPVGPGLRVPVPVAAATKAARRHGSATLPATNAAGTVDCPTLFMPQQATPPAADRAHV